LLGLHPLEQDLAALVRHAEVLREDLPHVRLGFSLPRVRKVDEACGFSPAAPVDDERFAKALLYLRLRFPKASLTLTTRERPELRDRLIPLGISKLSAGVTTSPGGYADGPAAGRAQFRIDDPRSLAEITEVVRRAGRTPVCG
jgi:2-iminoacetate synthase